MEKRQDIDTCADCAFYRMSADDVRYPYSYCGCYRNYSKEGNRKRVSRNTKACESFMQNGIGMYGTDR